MGCISSVSSILLAQKVTPFETFTERQLSISTSTPDSIVSSFQDETIKSLDEVKLKLDYLIKKSNK